MFALVSDQPASEAVDKMAEPGGPVPPSQDAIAAPSPPPGAPPPKSTKLASLRQYRNSIQIRKVSSVDVENAAGETVSEVTVEYHVTSTDMSEGRATGGGGGRSNDGERSPRLGGPRHSSSQLRICKMASKDFESPEAADGASPLRRRVISMQISASPKVHSWDAFAQDQDQVIMREDGEEGEAEAAAAAAGEHHDELLRQQQQQQQKQGSDGDLDEGSRSPEPDQDPVLDKLKNDLNNAIGSADKDFVQRIVLQAAERREELSAMGEALFAYASSLGIALPAADTAGPIGMTGSQPSMLRSRTSAVVAVSRRASVSVDFHVEIAKGSLRKASLSGGAQQTISRAAPSITVLPCCRCSAPAPVCLLHKLADQLPPALLALLTQLLAVLLSVLCRLPFYAGRARRRE